MTTSSDTPFDFVAGNPLEQAFFDRDPRLVACDLLGCLLVCDVGGEPTGGLIVETEAYLGSADAGSHAATKGVTARNRVMYGPPGSVYVYFTYGNHHMLNLVCEQEGTAGAVLLRALEPLVGIEAMTARRGGRSLVELCSGPGRLAQALGIDLSDNGTMLGTGRLQVYAGTRSPQGEVATSGRVGLREGHDLPYRYYISGNPYVSRGRTGPSAPSRHRALHGPEGA